MSTQPGPDPPLTDPRAHAGQRQVIEPIEPITDYGGSVDEFSPLKPASTDPTGTLPKFGEARFFRGVFGRNTLDFYEIYVDLNESSEISNCVHSTHIIMYI